MAPAQSSENQDVPGAILGLPPESIGGAPALTCYEASGFARVADRTPDMGSEWVWLFKSYDNGDESQFTKTDFLYSSSCVIPDRVC